MKGDFSRDSFDRLRHYSRVLKQQGRVELDSDDNERQAIQLHLLRSLAADVIGPHGGPGTGFQIVTATDGQFNFKITKGHYYVDGWLCENEEDVHYKSGAAQVPQPWLPKPDVLVSGKRYLVYLDVWERHLSATEADGPVESSSPTAMREVALGGPDTATRAQVVWQAKVSLGEGAPVLPTEPVTSTDWAEWMDKNWAEWQSLWQPPWRGQLKAKAAEATEVDATKPCLVSPQSRYRGLENQLYRIEVHRGGRAGDATPPTFVWSRENGSVVFAVERIDERSMKLVAGWRDARFGLEAGDIVEISDEDIALSGTPGSLVRVTDVDLDTLTIKFEGDRGRASTSRRAILRRWDHGRRKDDADVRKASADGRPKIADDLGLAVTEGQWLAIEDGISVLLEKATETNVRHQYRNGDYWLIPARTAIGDVLWPRSSSGEQKTLPPHGVEHHYAPLAVVTVGTGGMTTVNSAPRRRFKSLVELS